ncbi:hypothetical protein QBC46DRAFT_370657 [Diplogelasinospora grovesii]|uniref:Uncharacterized protein n=1 Tax=Diplogelasinospora grovesii TaxID=303347 RepID=A0AAN6NJM4_9PEZI|nr:hypothetical protein QBC46DRAFT_370657 [Diplogelasinospora grovesii]
MSALSTLAPAAAVLRVDLVLRASCCEVSLGSAEPLPGSDCAAIVMAWLAAIARLPGVRVFQNFKLKSMSRTDCRC